jgi:hypothetical protein
MATETIFMPLRNEGTDVWRPVKAERLSDGLFRVIGPAPDDEEWAFAPGSTVKVQRQVLSSGEALIAVSIQAP